MRLRDAFGPLFQDEDFVALYAVLGQPGYAPWRLALVTILQYEEGLRIGKPTMPYANVFI